MGKRISILFFITAAMLCGLTLRIISINAGDYARTASYSNSKTIVVDTSRGCIYDCNLEPLVKTQDEYAIAVKPTPAGLNSVSSYISKERLAALREELSLGNPALIRTSQEPDEGTDIKVVKYKRRYSDDQLAVHLIGYLDADGNGVTGIESSYDEYLSEDTGKLRAAFYVDAMGRNLGGAEIDILDDGYGTRKGVALTIDSKVQRALEEAMDECFINSGCAVAMDPDTGEIKAMVSRPTYNQFDIAGSMKASDSPLLNKALGSYSVGSTFKVIVSAAAIESDPLCYNNKFNCTGSITESGTVFNCFQQSVHGEETMCDALIHSCNTYFIDLSVKLGAGEILTLAERLGFGKGTALCKDIVSKEGNLPDINEFVSSADSANLGFGQGSLLATPIQIASAFSCVANGGYSVNASLLKGYVDEDGNLKESGSSRKGARVLRKGTCDALKEMLEQVVKVNEKALPKKVSAAGKTATAQTGQYRDDKEICNSWFAGWYPADKPELVIVIMKEYGVSGNADCAPVFKKTVDSLTMENN